MVTFGGWAVQLQCRNFDEPAGVNNERMMTQVQDLQLHILISLRPARAK